ncbi:hypothetical protein MFIFM68171_06592 [Madurella fahalii]|uniref:Heterokaryon incompatibility domain-containing protein n=1 Tax=Madurella fahalii TaxID=1157608 RepID=A0ABQ0GF36_9PEZI
MRLLHTTTLTLHTFVEPSQAPKYAILSHTWTDDEVIFEDIATPERGVEVVRNKRGFAKVRGSCAMAVAQGIDYIWIDTLCIDKSSSAELSEAINSMFEWYALSSVCFAYVADLDWLKPTSTYDGVYDRFLASRWFTRGWTLQELIAPSVVEFYDKSWKPIGDRRRLAEPISTKTGIYRGLLSRQHLLPQVNHDSLRQELSSICIAAKMSWLSHRQTTRREDMAYCMLGIFDLNMPLLYGEGNKAFIRLQEEIVRNSFDSSILAWNAPDQGHLPIGRWDTILSPSPALFRESAHVQPLRGQPRFADGNATPYGLNLNVLLCPTLEPMRGRGGLKSGLEAALLREAPESLAAAENGGISLFLAILDCCMEGNFTKRIAILMYRHKDHEDREAHANRAVPPAFLFVAF